MLKYPLLHSGFTMIDERGLLRPTPAPASFAETILFVAKNREHEPFFFSEDVTTLFNEWRGNPKVIKGFDFKERILIQAFKMFGIYLNGWVNFQSRKATFSYTHKQFLDTMLPWTQNPDLIETDPSTDALKWVGLLSPTSGHDVPYNYEQEISDRFAGARDAGRTDYAVRNWVSRQGGYESLLTYLFIIFGERTGHTQSQFKSVS